MTAVIVPYEPWHLGALHGRESEQQAFAALGGVGLAAEMCDGHDYAYSVLIDGVRSVACIGVSKQWKGVGSAWAFLGEDACHHFKTIHRGVLTFLRGAFCDGEFHRIQTAVRMDHVEGHRWARHLGFKPYAPLDAFGPNGEDFMGYVRLSPEREASWLRSRSR